MGKFSKLLKEFRVVIGAIWITIGLWAIIDPIGGGAMNENTGQILHRGTIIKNTIIGTIVIFIPEIINIFKKIFNFSKEKNKR